MLEFVTAVIGGFILLVWGADRFVMGASATARNLGVSPLIIGLTIVGFGTSAPEMLVSALAAWSGNPGISIGNAIGSNITNIALVLGATAVYTPVIVNSDTLRREYPILFLIMILTLLLLSDGFLSRWDGIILLFSMLVMVYWVVQIGLKTRKTDPLSTEFNKEIPIRMPMRKAVLWLVVGLGTLLIASKLVVFGASGIARAFGVSDLIIGLTVVAIGTSLPELAASIISVMKKEHDIAIGNVLGSNMFNLLGVMGLPGLIHPFAIPPEALSRDYALMFVLTIALFIMSYGFAGKQGNINRIEGGILLGVFFAYLGYLTLQQIGTL